MPNTIVGDRRRVEKINKELKEEHSLIPWNLISGLRNRIAHDYRSVDPNISFDIVQNYLPGLKAELILMLEKVEFEQALLEKVVNTPQYGRLKYLIKKQ